MTRMDKRREWRKVEEGRHREKKNGIKIRKEKKVKKVTVGRTKG